MQDSGNSPISFSYSYSPDIWPALITFALVIYLGLIGVLFIVTNDVHHLIWTGFQMHRYVIASPGRLYWFFTGYIYLLGLVNFVVLVWLAISSPGQRLPVAIILSGQIVCGIVYAIDKLDNDLIGPGESVLFTIGVVAVAYALALLRFHAIDPVAAARKAVLRQMSEGLLVVDLQGRIVDVNPMAASILGLPEKNLCEKRFTEVMPVDEDLLEQLRNKKIDQTDIALGEGTSARHYTLKLTSLRGRRGEIIGQKDTHADVRQSILNLRSTSDREWSFITALKKYIEKFRLNYGIRTELSLCDEIEENTFDPLVEVQLFRVIQEALTNARKHSGAHTLTVIMGLDGNKTCITITDDGHGFDTGQLEGSTGSHFGLIFMQERMEQNGGSLKIDSIPGGGTVLKLDVPIREKKEGK